MLSCERQTQSPRKGIVDTAASDHSILTGMLHSQRKDSTAAKILSAAEELFVSRSYADVTIDQVAADASVTKGAIYHHFSSKEHLYLTMLQLDLADKQRIYREAIAKQGTSRERLRRLTATFLGLSETKQNLVGLVRRDINSFGADTRTALVNAYQEALPNLVEEVIRDGIRDREIVDGDARLLAWHFVATVEITLVPYAQEQLTTDESKMNHVMRLFFEGCARENLEKQI